MASQINSIDINTNDGYIIEISNDSILVSTPGSDVYIDVLELTAVRNLYEFACKSMKVESFNIEQAEQFVKDNLTFIVVHCETYFGSAYTKHSNY